MPIKIQERILEPYWEVHLFLRNGQYWTALDAGDCKPPQMFDKNEALAGFETAKATYRHIDRLRLVKFTPEEITAT